MITSNPPQRKVFQVGKPRPRSFQRFVRFKIFEVLLNSSYVSTSGFRIVLKERAGNILLVQARIDMLYTTSHTSTGW